MSKFTLGSLLQNFSLSGSAMDIGQKAPLFSAKNQDGIEFRLADNESKHWTVLYFYPMAATPGCTKQACAFRDGIHTMEKLNARVYGISTDAVMALKKFKAQHKLPFDLLSDPDAKIASAYKTKVALLNYSKRHTFIIDPQLVIRYIDRNVDPAKDSKKVAAVLDQLQKA